VTHQENNKESLLITKTNGDDYDILEIIPSLPSRLYYTYIKRGPHVVYKVIFKNIDAFQIWHDRLGHHSIGMMKKIIGNYTGHNLTKFFKTSNFICMACVTGELILRPSLLTIHTEPLKFLKRIQGDICGQIQPTSGSFRYFMVLIDASTRWACVCLLPTWNHAFAKIMAQVIRLKVSVPCRSGTPIYKPQVKTSCRACNHSHVPYGSEPRLPAEVDSDAASCPMAPGLASRLRWDPVLPCVLWLRTSPLS
jgi:hypothetical protein